MLGVVVVVPMVALAVWVTARLGIGNQAITMVETIRMAALFAGTAAILTAGGVGRLAAHASTLPGGRKTAVWRAARAQAVASAGLVIIAAIPHGQLPEAPVKWLWIAGAGAVSGGIAGTIIGLICGAPFRPRTPTVKDILRAMPGAQQLRRRAGTSMVSIPAAAAEPAAAPAPAATPAPVAATAKPRKRRKPPVTDPPKPAPEPARAPSRAALVTSTPAPAPPPTGLARSPRIAVEAPVVVDTSVATEPSAPTTDGGATPLPKPVPLGDDITGVEDIDERSESSGVGTPGATPDEPEPREG